MAELTNHTWTPQNDAPEADYATQVALPVHFAPGTQTKCGIPLGRDREVLIRSTDIKGDVTCPKCK